MKQRIKKFNENLDDDTMYAISSSFSKVKEELYLLNKRLKWSSIKSEEIDEIRSEISQMKINFDELQDRFNDFEDRYFGRRH